MKTLVQERRRVSRSPLPASVGVNLLHPRVAVAPDGINFSERGLCLRVGAMLEVRSLVRLQLTSTSGSLGRLRPVECTGRVAWVIQRLDLRNIPPFLFDIGIEFVDPPPVLRQLMAQRSTRPVSLKGRRPILGKSAESVTIHGRQFVPRLESDPNHPVKWHLVVSVDEVPCFSGRYPSERAAIAAWTLFRRQQARLKRGGPP